jgi:hypothetical protein
MTRSNIDARRHFEDRGSLRTAALRDALVRGDRTTAMHIVRETEATQGTAAMLRIVIAAASTREVS